MEKLAFDALVTNDKGRFLIEDYAVSYMPSATSFPLLTDWKPPADTRPLLAFADPAYLQKSGSVLRTLLDEDSFMPSPLPHTRSEVNAIASIVGDGADVFSGTDATEDRLKEMQLSRYRILHFATHSVASLDHPERSALVLSLDSNPHDDGFLQVREIYNLKLNADLVVLSACQTNAGAEGIHGARGSRSCSRVLFRGSPLTRCKLVES